MLGWEEKIYVCMCSDDDDTLEIEIFNFSSLLSSFCIGSYLSV